MEPNEVIRLFSLTLSGYEKGWLTGSKASKYLLLTMKLTSESMMSF